MTLNPNDQVIEVLAAAAAGDPNDLTVGTVELLDLELQALCDAYRMIARTRTMSRALRSYYQQHIDQFESLLHARGIEQRDLARDLALPGTWAEVEALEEQADEEPT